jgi:hypothetical protein
VELEATRQQQHCTSDPLQHLSNTSQQQQQQHASPALHLRALASLHQQLTAKLEGMVSCACMCVCMCVYVYVWAICVCVHATSFLDHDHFNAV